MSPPCFRQQKMLEFLDFIRHRCTACIVYNIKFCHLINQCRTSHPNQILGCQFKHQIVTILCHPLCFLREKFHLIKIAIIHECNIKTVSGYIC